MKHDLPPALAVAEDERDLHRAILEAHDQGDPGPLGRLYARVADMREAQDAIDACCFYLTQAYVYALDAGDPAADALGTRLRSYGREH